MCGITSAECFDAWCVVLLDGFCDGVRHLNLTEAYIVAEGVEERDFLFLDDFVGHDYTDHITQHSLAGSRVDFKNFLYGRVECFHDVAGTS